MSLHIVMRNEPSQPQQFPLFAHVWAPAPRALMRLSLVEQLIRTVPRHIRNIVEIGPGVGDLGLFLADYFRDAHVRLFEISEQGTTILEDRVAGNPRVSIETRDFRGTQRPGTSDLVVACEVFEHLPEDDTAFRAVRRFLRPEGYFLFSAPAFMKKWGPADEYAGHYRRYERSEIIEKFRSHGFEIQSLWCYGFPVTHLLNSVSRVYYRRQVRLRPLPKLEATKRSGSDRAMARRLSVSPVVTLMRPLFFVQNLMKNTNIGDGYLVLARKMSEAQET